MNQSFSKITPKLQIAWDASSLKNLQFCPRYYEMTNIEGWQTDSTDLEFGRFIADGFEQYQKLRLNGESREDAAMRVVRRALEATWNEDGTQWGGRYETMWKCCGEKPYRNAKGNRAKCPFAHDRVWMPGDAPDICVECGSAVRSERRYLPVSSQKNRHTLIRALIWYALEQPEEITDGLHPYVFPDGTMAVELSGRLPLPWKAHTGEDFMLTWHLDYIGEYGSEHFIVDNKTTTKTLNSAYYSRYSPDTQFDTYDMIASITFPELDIKGVMIDAVQVMVGGVEFGRQPYYKTEEQREEHFKDLEVWFRQAEGYAMADYWPMKKSSCWLCPLKAVCSQTKSMREGYLRSNFTKGEPWDPMRTR